MKDSFKNCAMTPFNSKWENVISRLSPLEKRYDDIRTEFDRDYTRIIHSNAYRRLKHKTQVFFSPENDHICTRIEHVTHVDSISYTIASYLGLNTELTKAIAVAHDLGHSPFGHEGEKILSKISQRDLKTSFWHEKNGVHLVDSIELLEGHDGYKKNLNLCYGVRDGIISHCGEIDENSLKPRDKFIDLNDYIHPNQYSPYTWEGCVVKIADKISGYFVPAVIGIAIITFIVYLILGYDIGTALSTFITVLVVACPCSLGLATPLAIVVSEGLCASNGILVKKSEILENASKIDTIVFDKTGTLTYGSLKISKIYNYSEIAEKELMQLAGSIEEKSTHPIGKAFVDYMYKNNIPKLKVENMQNVAGHGIVGTINNGKVILGNRKILEKFSIENNHLEDEKNLALNGNSIIYVANEKQVLALIGVNDVVRENAKDVIKEIKEHNIKTIMLTGDNKETAEKISKELGITEVISNVLPSQKSETIKMLKEKGNKVMMCGDGINDSPALTNADIGVSVKSGTDIAMDSSDVILTKNDLYSVLKLIKISEKTVKNIKQNLFWAFFYNCLMIPVAIGFFKPLGISINPMLASLAMVFSSLTVILNALRLRK